MHGTTSLKFILKILTGNNTGLNVTYDISLQIIFLTYVEEKFKSFQYNLYSRQLNIKPTETETQEHISTHLYTGCPSRNVPEFGRVFLRSNYTDITQNTYIQS